jgi:hypothetical protein
MKIAKTKVSFSIKLAVFLASGAAYMKLHEIQGHFYEVPHAISSTDFVVVLVSQSP